MPKVEGAPEGVNKILEAAYASALKKYPGNKAKASQIAWGAVKNAGWVKDKDGKWVMSKEHRERSRFFSFGGAGSGNYGHAGIPGQVGGSSSGGGSGSGESIRAEHLARATSDYRDETQRIKDSRVSEGSKKMLQDHADHRMNAKLNALQEHSDQHTRIDEAHKAGQLNSAEKESAKSYANQKLSNDFAKAENFQRRASINPYKHSEQGETIMPKQFSMIPVKDIVVFRAGTYPQGEYTEADLDEIVEAYSESNHVAPVTVGHVSDYIDSRAPRFGVIGSLKRVGKDLVASGVELAEELIDWIKDGYYSDRSIALYPRGDASNPTPGKLNVHHLAILGGQPPQVKGMPQLAFSSADEFVEIPMNFAEPDIQAIVGMASQDTLAGISEEFAECLKQMEAIIDEPDDDDDDEEDMRECFNILSECMNQIGNDIRRHYDFLEKSDSISDRFLEKVSVMKEKLKHLISIKQPRKESEMDEKVLKEFRELQSKVKEQDALIVSFAEEKKKLEAKATADAQAAEEAKKKDVDARVEASLKEFKAELVKANYPVKKLEEEGVLALAKQLLTANELEFGEGKKKPAMEVLKGLLEGTAKVNTGIEFTEDQELVNVAEVLGLDRSLPVDAAGMRKIQFCEQHYQKHADQYKGVDHKVALAQILRDVQAGKIKYAGK